MANTELILTRNEYIAELKKPSSLVNMYKLWRLEKQLDKLITANK